MSSVCLWIKESVVNLFSVTDDKRNRYDQGLNRLKTERKVVKELYENTLQPQDSQNNINDAGDLSAIEFSDSFEGWFRESQTQTARSIAFLSKVRESDWFFYRLSRWALRKITGYETDYAKYLRRAEKEVGKHLNVLGKSSEIMAISLERFKNEIRQGISEKISYEALAEKARPLSLLSLQNEIMCKDLVETFQKVDGWVHRFFRWMGSQVGQKTAFGDLLGRAKALRKKTSETSLVVSGWSKAVAVGIQLLELKEAKPNDESRSVDQIVDFLKKVDDTQKRALELTEKYQVVRKEQDGPSWYDELRDAAYALTNTVSITPKGIPNDGNTCYIASAMQLLSQASMYGYSEHFGNAPLQAYSYEDADGNSVLDVKEEDLAAHTAVRNHVRPAIEQLAGGARFKDAYKLTEQLYKDGMTDVPAGSQGCALEVFDNIWNSIQAPPFFCKGQDGLDKKTRELTRMLTCPVYDPHLEQPKTLDDALTRRLRMHKREKLEVEHLPLLLPIGLSRVEFQDGKMVKQNQVIEVPDYWQVPGELLDDESKSVAYRLVGFIRHWDDNGSGDEGHYTTYLKRGPHWVHADDSSARRVPDGERKNEQSRGVLYLFERIV